MVRRSLGDTGPVPAADLAASDDDGLVILDNPDEARYEARRGEVVAGFSEYRLLRGRIAFIHTETDPSFAGRSIGSRLVRGLLDDVRARGLKVTPRCAFVAGFIERHPEYRDMVSWGRDGSSPR